MIESREYRVESFAPGRPDHALIELLHRRQANHICFTHARGGRWVQGANVAARDLDRWFPEISPQLVSDAYFSIHGFYGTSRSSSPWCSGLRGGMRNRRRVQWLTACFVDLDTYSVGKSLEEVSAEVRRLESSGELPIASAIVHSGRGIWLLWFLEADEGPTPIRARAGPVARFAEIQSALVGRLFDLGADPQASDACRVIRIPGSMNSKSSSRVSYDMRFDRETGRAVVYRLGELAEAIGISNSKHVETRPAASVDPVASAHGRSGPWGRAWINVLRFVALIFLRADRGFAVGVRHSAAWLLAMWLRELGVSPTTAIETLHYFFERYCAHTDASGKPDRVGRSDARDCVHAVYATRQLGYRVRNSTVTQKLRITPAEAREIAANLGPGWEFVSDGHGDGDLAQAPSRRLTRRSAKAEQRRELLRTFVDAPIESASLKDLVLWLERFGVSASRETIRKDLSALRRPPTTTSSTTTDD